MELQVINLSSEGKLLLTFSFLWLVRECKIQKIDAAKKGHIVLPVNNIYIKYPKHKLKSLTLLIVNGKGPHCTVYYLLSTYITISLVSSVAYLITGVVAMPRAAAFTGLAAAPMIVRVL